MNSNLNSPEQSEHIENYVKNFVLKHSVSEVLHDDFYLRRFSAKVSKDIKTVADLICLTPDQFKIRTGATDKQLYRVQTVLKKYDLSLR